MIDSAALIFKAAEFRARAAWLATSAISDSDEAEKVRNAQIDIAYEWLEKAVGAGLVNPEGITNNQWLGPLTEDRRFQSIISGMVEDK